MAVSKRLRFEILRRDNHACRYCGGVAPAVVLTVDHVVPVALGGSDDPSNLVTACEDCNAGKAATSPGEKIVDDVAQDAVRWSNAIKRAAQIEETSKASRRLSHEDVWEYWTGLNPRWAYPTAGWEQTVDRLMDAGLGIVDIFEAIDTASSAFGVTQRNRWRYFCGICWRTIERRQEAARAILAVEEGSPPDA